MPYPYETLALPETASQEEIRKQYLERIQVDSPERHPEAFQEVAEAYEFLKSEERRAKLKCFGMTGVYATLRMADLLPKPKNQRPFIPAGEWLRAIREIIQDPEAP
jgi:DnaJ-class molecular chaperone